MKVKEESEKFGLKLNIQKTKIMASGPITSWEIGGETVETVSDFIFVGSKITANGDCSHEIKRHLLLGRKVMTNLDSVFKSRDITLPTKVHLVKAMIFLVIMYGCESWTVKKTEHRGLISFKMDWLDLLAVQGTLQESSPTPQFKSISSSINSSHSAFFTVQLSHPYMTTGKTIALTRRTLVCKVMSLLLNILSRLVITFLPRSKRVLISWLRSPSAVILEPKKI